MELTALVDIVLALLHLSFKHPVKNSWLLRHSSKAFGQNCDLVSRYIKFLQCLANDLLVHAVRIDIGRIPSCQAYGMVSFRLS
jgi:hypothetical protein